MECECEVLLEGVERNRSGGSCFCFDTETTRRLDSEELELDDRVQAFDKVDEALKKLEEEEEEEDLRLGC
jgi:flagellar motility protein MotE (MotC chaperone)